MTRPDQLRIETGHREHLAQTHLLINGIDILELERPSTPSPLDLGRTSRPSPAAPGSRRTLPYHPADPVGLLPPDSHALLPTATPTPAMIGICTCHEPGCGSLWMQIYRHGEEVIWEPTTQTPRGSVRHSWRFALVPYLDALDAAAGPRPWENRALLLARELRTWRDTLFGGGLGRGAELIHAWARPGQDSISATVASSTGWRFLSLTVGPNDTCGDLLLRLSNDLDATAPDWGPGGAR